MRFVEILSKKCNLDDLGFALLAFLSRTTLKPAALKFVSKGLTKFDWSKTSAIGILVMVMKNCSVSFRNASWFFQYVSEG